MDEKQTPRWISGIEPSKELLAANGTQILEMECREQPKRLRELIAAYRSDTEVREQLERFHRLGAHEGPILFVGMGASYCSSISGSILLQSQGRSSFSVDAGEWLHYATRVWKDFPLSILLTTSGESAELVELAKKGDQKKWGLVCNNVASTCWTMAQLKLPILAGPEYGNATKTYTNAAAAAIILASEIAGSPWEEDADDVAEKLEEIVESVFSLRSCLEEFCRGAMNIEIIGRGAGFGAAMMGALTIREMSGHRAAAHTGAGFKHGPNLDVNETHVAIIFAVGRSAALGVKLAEECNGRGGKVVLVSTDEIDPTEKLFPVRIDRVPEPWEGITSILIPQALALGMVERTGCRLRPRFQYGVMEQ
jgi:glucosamine--fructose-6-phosphate aminotransferase (isomerizing)